MMIYYAKFSLFQLPYVWKENTRSLYCCRQGFPICTLTRRCTLLYIMRESSNRQYTSELCLIPVLFCRKSNLSLFISQKEIVLLDIIFQSTFS